MSKKIKYLVAPNPLDKNLTKEINGFDESFKKTKTKVIIEKDLTIYLNNQETISLADLSYWSGSTFAVEGSSYLKISVLTENIANRVP